MTASLYNLLVWALQPWVRLRLRRRARTEPLYGLAIEARFGQHDPATATPPGLPVFWLHAVSLGVMVNRIPVTVFPARLAKSNRTNARLSP